MEEYTYVDNKKLRCGFTTGSCAAAAAKAATLLLLTAKAPQWVNLLTPKGFLLHLLVENPQCDGFFAQCAIRKDSGDDPDVTNGALICATVCRTVQGIAVEGGKGVGRVTKPGLECPVGAAAINHVPRRMVEEAVQEICEECNYPGGISVEITVPQGKMLAEKTYNPRLGIVGGISILGTSGIVEPMSEKALVESIRVEMKVLSAEGQKYLLVTPGNYGEVFARDTLHLKQHNAVKCSNFVGETLDYALQLSVSGVLLVGHLGKFVKLAGGVMNTHSRYADCRMEILGAHAALAGASAQQVQTIMNCVTTDDAVEELQAFHLWDDVIKTLLKKIDYHLKQRTHCSLAIAAVIFSNRYGFLGQTEDAKKLILNFQLEDKA